MSTVTFYTGLLELHFLVLGYPELVQLITSIALHCVQDRPTPMMIASERQQPLVKDVTEKLLQTVLAVLGPTVYTITVT